MVARYKVFAQSTGYKSKVVGGLARVNVREVAHNIADEAADACEYSATLFIYSDDGKNTLISSYGFDGIRWSQLRGRVVTGLEGRRPPTPRVSRVFMSPC
jgi:hypothetical protein